MAAAQLLAAGSFVPITASQPVFKIVIFFVRTKHWLSIQPSPARAGTCRKQGCILAVLAASGARRRESRGRHVPRRLHRELKNMFMSSQQGPPRRVTPLLSLPFEAAGRSRVKVQAHIRVCSRHCWSLLLPARSHSPANAPVHPGHPKMKGSQGCLSALLPAVRQKGQLSLCLGRCQPPGRTWCHVIENPPTLTPRLGDSRLCVPVSC